MHNEDSIKPILLLALLLLVLSLVAYLLISKKWGNVPFLKNPTVITEKVVIPDTKEVGNVDGFQANKQSHQVPLAPKDDGERVLVTGAVYSPYTGYELVKSSALEWSDDAMLSMIKSLGTVTLEGTSSGWQFVFVSKKKSLGYEILIEGGEVVRLKEVPTNAIGGTVPENWSGRDASWAIRKLGENSQWQGATMTGLNFTYNPDAKGWDYIIANTYGGSSIRLR